MSKKTSEALEAIKEAINEAIAPSAMSKEEALDVLEEVSGDVQMQIEALRGEIEDETE